MIAPLTLLTVIGMAAATLATRLGGYLLLRGRRLSPRLQATMEAAPGCIIITVIAPQFATGRPADLLGLAVTVAASIRLPMLPTVVLGIAATALFRHFF